MGAVSDAINPFDSDNIINKGVRAAGHEVMDFGREITGVNARKAAAKQQAADQAVLDELMSKNPFENQNKYTTSLTNVGMPNGQQEAMKFQMDQAAKEVNNNMAGGGMLRSGAAAKALSDRQQGIANQNYQQAFDNSLRANDQNFRHENVAATNNADWAINNANVRFGLNNNKRQDAASNKGVIGSLISNLNPFS